ncbi:MAG: ROK family protein [Oscillospiraceae bacterium]|jgi:glucokinase|nr:ROK family protein [Oscillospiraceae bacterium]
MAKYYIGADIGGTNISVGLTDDKYKILHKLAIKTEKESGYGIIVKNIAAAVGELIAVSKIPFKKIEWLGAGCPGICNKDKGELEWSNNLNWRNVPLLNDLEALTGLPSHIDNDANAAAYGEFLAGAAKGTKSAVIITLGTGVGSGIILNKKIYYGANFAGGEIGHTVIEVDGYECTCGRKGCFEAYSSATGLVRMTKEALEKDKGSKMREIVDANGKISARTAFAAAKLKDKSGKEVVQKYIKYLAAGITNVVNTFQPDIVCLGGGVCGEGDNLLIPLKKLVKAEVFSKNSEKNAEIAICKLGNDAGIIGAAMLGKLG